MRQHFALESICSSYSKLDALALKRRRLRLDIHHRIQCRKRSTAVVDHLYVSCATLPEAASAHLVREPHTTLRGLDLDACGTLPLVPSDVFEQEDERVDRLERGQGLRI